MIKSIYKKVSSFFAQLDSLFKPEKDFVCLDIGSISVKGLVFSKGEIVDFFREKLEDTSYLVDILKKYKLLSKSVKIALKGEDTLIRCIPFPKIEKEKIKETFKYEIAKYIPFSAEEVYFDIFILDENYSQNEVFLMLAVIKKTFLDKLIKQLIEGRINCKEINLHHIALLNLFLKTEPDKLNCAIVEIGRSSTLLNLVKGVIPYLSREVKVGGQFLYEEISSIKNLRLEEVENFIATAEDKKEIFKIGDNFFSQLIEEIKKSLDYFEITTGEKIERIYLTGSFSKIEDIEEFIGACLKIEVTRWSPFAVLNLPCKKELYEQEEFFSVALGLGV